MPPTATGSSVIAKNLACGFDSDEIVMIGQVLYDNRIDLSGIEKIRRIRIPDYPFHWRIKSFFEPFYVIPLTVAAGVAATRRYKLRAVVACFPNAPFLFAGLLISIIAKVPFYPYYHNLYVETRTNRVSRTIAQIIQSISFSYAAQVFSMSKGMAGFLLKRYGQKSHPILHPIPSSIPAFRELPAAKRPYKIAITGNINFTMGETLRRLVSVIRDVSDFQLHIFTSTSGDVIRNYLRIYGDNIDVMHVANREQLIDSIRDCDLLTLALDERRGDLEDDFKTQFPTRTLELLVSERPILVLAPEDYYIARFFRETGAGEVVSSTDCETIRNAIIELCENPTKRNMYVRNALNIAKQYRVEKVVATLRSVLPNR